jgi:hypothetical protein
MTNLSIRHPDESQDRWRFTQGKYQLASDPSFRWDDG